MIAQINGIISGKFGKSCLVMTPGGVGYEIFVTEAMFARLPGEGEEISLYTRTIVREDSLDLYGFDHPDERETFDVLISLSKLGPKTAMAILSHFDPESLRTVVALEDAGALEKVPGIGMKSARRILVELKDRLKAPQKGPAAVQTGERGVVPDALSGLINLGYTETEAVPVLNRIMDEQPDLDVGALLREALKALARERA